MDAVGVLGIVQELASVRRVSDLMKRLLRGIRMHAEVPITLCYLRDALGEQLHVVASEGIAASRLPSLSSNELDNPLWYCMHTRKACLVDQPSGLLGIGADFEALREALGEQAALLAWPLLDAQGQSIGALVLSGEVNTLYAWRNDRVWAAVMMVHQCLLATLTEHQGHAELLSGAVSREGARRQARLLIEREFAGDSSLARQLREELLLLAESRLAVLITGETGVGKDHAACLIHQASARSHEAFVPVNCASIPKDLIGAELFGCTRGAYTGATEAREGLVASADGGTLFLDEIGDMPLSLQGTLLRLLNEKKYRPVGAVEEQVSDFRLICATHQPLLQLVREGRFRQDLYFRICQLTLQLPALRERRGDLESLAATLIRHYNGQHRRFVTGIAAAAVQVLLTHAFDGNIRELRNLILAACERTPCGQSIERQVLQTLMRQTLTLEGDPAPVAGIEPDAMRALLETDDLPQAVETFERMMIDARLQQLGGSRRRAAESLGVPKRTLARKCQKWNLESAAYE